MRNFARINNYYNRIEAVKDWNKLAAEILKTDHWRLVWKYKPADNAGWRKIDKAIARLREEFAAVEHKMHPTSGGLPAADSLSTPATTGG